MTWREAVWFLLPVLLVVLAQWLAKRAEAEHWRKMKERNPDAAEAEEREQGDETPGPPPV
jgi:cytochrome c-type biogenesis protein CcmH/NrfF